MGKRHLYVALVEKVRSLIESARRDIGIQCNITGRAKDLGSFVKKIVSKKYDSADKVGDKAGVRAVCWFQEHRDRLIEVVKPRLETFEWDDKRKSLDYNKLGYLGVHCQARLKPEDTTTTPELSGLQCEVQFHTMAENAWSTPLHDLAYKPPIDVPVELKRGMYRLLGVLELYDNEVSRLRESILKMPGFKEAQVLTAIDPHYYRLVGDDYNKALSLQALHSIARLFEHETAEATAAKLNAFAETRSDKLKRIWNEEITGEGAVVRQPEAIAIFHGLESDRYTVEECLKNDFGEWYFEEFVLAWGMSLE